MDVPKDTELCHFELAKTHFDILHLVFVHHEKYQQFISAYIDRKLK
jgi:hypothetical protein